MIKMTKKMKNTGIIYSIPYVIFKKKYYLLLETKKLIYESSKFHLKSPNRTEYRR